MNTIGFRLREERDKLGLNQTDFAKLVGQSRGSQAHYERDERAPDARYLSSLAEIGIDVLYILTGNKTPTSMDEVSMEEQKLIENYRAMDDSAKLNIQAVGDSFAQSKPNLKTG